MTVGLPLEVGGYSSTETGKLTQASRMQQVGADDDWVAEAYMGTAYSHLTQADLERALLEHALFVLKGSRPEEDSPL